MILLSISCYQNLATGEHMLMQEATLTQVSHFWDDRSSFPLLKNEQMLRCGHKAWRRGRLRQDRESDRTQFCRRIKKGVMPIHNLGMIVRRQAAVD